jgi:hypothetical protein
MTRNTKISLIVAGVLVVGSLPTMSGCLRAYGERRKVSIGMSVNTVFRTLDAWDLCISSYLDEPTHEFGMFNAMKDRDGEVYRIPKYNKTFLSKDEFVQFVGQEMSNGKPWNSQFTYYAGPIRNTFRVDFDASGKVVSISEMGGGP